MCEKSRPLLFFLPEGTATATRWRPPVNVYRTRTGWLLAFDLAGVRLEDVGVSVSGCRVTVTGVRREWRIEEIASTYAMEISFDTFERIVDLPCELENPPTRLQVEDGILFIRVQTESTEETQP